MDEREGLMLKRKDWMVMRKDVSEACTLIDAS